VLLFRVRLNANLSFVRFHESRTKGEPRPVRMTMLAATICLSKFFQRMCSCLIDAGIPRYSVSMTGNGDISSRALNIYQDWSMILEFQRLMMSSQESAGSISVARDCHCSGRHSQAEGATS